MGNNKKIVLRHIFIPVLPKMLLFRIQKIQDIENNPHSDTGIGNIKGRPVILIPVEIEEINDFPDPYPVDKVPQGTGKYQGEGYFRNILPLGQMDEQKKNGRHGNERQDNKKNKHKPRIETGQEAESSTPVPEMDQRKEVLDTNNLLIETDTLFNGKLA
jgi:hypothetical protein